MRQGETSMKYKLQAITHIKNR